MISPASLAAFSAVPRPAGAASQPSVAPPSPLPDPSAAGVGGAPGPGQNGRRGALLDISA